ncbi:cytochrome P450 [Flagelloscypha sp. PMI_526]|nr:cytochrome P450 [Flagelloscypha sp. PMI_526]
MYEEQLTIVQAHPWGVFSAVVVFLVIYYQYGVSSRHGRHLPPGPKGLPLIGNLHQLTRKMLWLKLQSWTNIYGPIYYLNLAGQDVLVLGSHEVASDLLVKRSGKYSDRMRSHVAFDLLCGGLAFSLAPYNDFWKRSRRGAHEAMKIQVTPNYRPIHLSEAYLTIGHLLEHPDDYDGHIRRSSASFVFRAIYGTPALKPNDPDIRRVQAIAERAGKAAGPNQHLVEYFPWMEYLPDILAPWRVWAKDWFQKDSELLERMFRDVQAKMSKGEQRPCVASKLIEESSSTVDIKEQAWLLATLFAAGSDSTATIMSWFLLSMVVHPEVQKAAQAQLDQAVGRDRLPNFSDIDTLPLIHAIIIEVMRWRPSGAFAIPHRSTEDDLYKGFFIPKGTMCIPNVWTMNHDPAVYGSDADNFHPARHLDASTGRLLPPTPLTQDESHVTFGFGRRICVARHVAKQGLFINVASILWAFNLEAEDVSSLKYGPEDCVDEGLSIRPLPFKCKITPRFNGVQAALNQAKEAGLLE